MEHLIQLIVIVLMIPALLALHMLVVVAIPEISRKLTETTGRRPLLCFAAGLVVTALLLAVAHAFRPAAPFVLVILAFFLLCGLPAMATDIGRRIWALQRREATSFGSLVTGWLVFAFASLVPFVGWFLVFPWLTLTAVGSLIVSLWRVRPSDQTNE